MGRIKLHKKKERQAPAPIVEERKVPGPTPPFREGTQVSMTKVAFVYNAGGIGDYVNWTTAIRYAIDTNPHLYGYIVSPPYFADLARHWLGNYSDRFSFRVSASFEKEKYLENVACIVPNKQQYANAGGFHLFNLGFIFYNQINYIPEGYETVPHIKGDEIEVSQFNLPPHYAVICPNATADNRRLPSEVINSVADYMKERGLTPVYLGKKSLAKDYSATADDGLSSEGVLDLRERTNLLEAAVIMAGAEFIFGPDSGLLHLASCTDRPVAWVFSSVDPKLRVPPRPVKARNISISPPRELGCRFCQSQMRFVIGHDFKNCLYGDSACVTRLKGSDIVEVLKKSLNEEDLNGS